MEIPDDLFRQAKARAALQGIPLKDLIVHGLQLALEDGRLEPKLHRVCFPLIRSTGPIITDEDVARALQSFELYEVEPGDLPE